MRFDAMELPYEWLLLPGSGKRLQLLVAAHALNEARAMLRGFTLPQIVHAATVTDSLLKQLSAEFADGHGDDRVGEKIIGSLPFLVTAAECARFTTAAGAPYVHPGRLYVLLAIEQFPSPEATTPAHTYYVPICMDDTTSEWYPATEDPSAVLTRQVSKLPVWGVHCILGNGESINTDTSYLLDVMRAIAQKLNKA